MAELKELASRFYEMVAPVILGNELAKKVVTLQIFTNPSVGEKLHILLTGEPASGKTVIGYDVSKICPKAHYSASNLTKVGLLEKLIATHGGIMVIDEFGRLKKEVRDGLLEAMQTGTVSIDKHDEHYRYDAKVNILAISNPKGDRLVDGMPIINQLPYGLPLLSRFHVIIPFWSVGSERYPDIAKNMVLQDNDEERIRYLRDIVTKVKTKVPVVTISESLAEEVGDIVRYLKSISYVGDLISPRLIEGFISMAKARARMELRDHVTKSDIEYIENLMLEVDANAKGEKY